MHRRLAVPVPTFRLRDSLSECYITGRCLPAMTPRVLVMGDELRTEENFFRWTITINSFTGRSLPPQLATHASGGSQSIPPGHPQIARIEHWGILLFAWSQSPFPAYDLPRSVSENSSSISRISLKRNARVWEFSSHGEDLQELPS